jgi:hypothetical protein
LPSPLFVFSGLAGAAIALGAYFFPAIRDAEARLPDFDAEPATEEARGRRQQSLERRRKRPARAIERSPLLQ